MNDLPIAQVARNLLQDGKIDICISELNKWFAKNKSEEKIWKKTYDEFIVISSQHSNISKASMLNTVKHSSLQTKESQIVKSLLQFLDDFEKSFCRSVATQEGNEHLLVSDVEDGDGNTIVETKNLDIEITINREFENYSEKDKKLLLAAIKNLLETDQDIAIKRMRKGSVKLLLELTPTQCERLHWAIQRGELDDFDVVDSEIIESKIVHHKQKVGQPTINSIAEINSTRMLVINWPDDICTFINEAYNASTGVLTILYSFVDKMSGLQPQKNKFSLNSFDTSIGNVTKVVFRQVSDGRPSSGGPNSVSVSKPNA